MKQLSKTEADHKISVISGMELEARGAPVNEQRKARMRPHLAAIGDDVIAEKRWDPNVTSPILIIARSFGSALA